MTKNKPCDLNDQLFDQLEPLSSEGMSINDIVKKG